MLSYHNSEDLKLAYQALMAEHRAADDLIQGKGWENGKGCFIGCMFHSYDHSRFPIEIGAPEELAHLADKVFESLSNGDAQKWTEQFPDAMPVGVDLEPAVHKIKARMLREIGWYPEHINDDIDQWGVCAAIEEVAKLHDENVPDGDSRWSVARSVARSAAVSAAVSAAWSAAWSAAVSAAESAAVSTAVSAAWLKIRDIVLEELAVAK